jgi:hypothetical protein
MLASSSHKTANGTKRHHALHELLSSERAYASDLALIREVHIPLALGEVLLLCLFFAIFVPFCDSSCSLSLFALGPHGNHTFTVKDRLPASCAARNRLAPRTPLHTTDSDEFRG